MIANVLFNIGLINFSATSSSTGCSTGDALLFLQTTRGAMEGKFPETQHPAMVSLWGRCHGKEMAAENECAACSRGGCTCVVPENCACSSLPTLAFKLVLVCA